MSTTACSATLDLRAITPSERSAMILSVFKSLIPGQAVEVLCDHEDQSLRDQLSLALPGQFAWADLEQAPGAWRAAITRLASANEGQKSTGCCGGCGG